MWIEGQMSIFATRLHPNLQSAILLFVCQSTICNLQSAILPSSAHAQESKAPLFIAHAADGSNAEGTLLRLGADWSVTLGGDKSVTVPGADLIGLQRKARPLPPAPQQEHVLFVNGDRVPGQLLQLTEEALTFQPAFGDKKTELKAPLTAVLLCWFAAPDGVEDAHLLRRRLATDRRRRDLILLRNGDRLEGTLLSVNAREARLTVVSGKEVRVERDRVAALALNTELARQPRPRGPYGRVVLANGCRLALASLQIREDDLAGTTLFGATVQMPLSQLVGLSIYQGRAVYLSDLQSRHYEHTPYLDLRWPFVRDASVAGHDMRLAGNTYDKGIGLHSESRLIYDLNGRYQWFESLVGLDEQTGRQGSVLIEVLVDGKRQDLGNVKELTGWDPPRAIRVNVAGTRELTLVVKFGRFADVEDHVDWADARLIK